MRHEPLTPAIEILETYTPATLRPRWDGWTADRQRTFLSALAETGCISEACHRAQVTARSAYRLRADPRGETFAQAWDQALRFASSKLLTLAYERAIRRSIREIWRDGQLIAEHRAPSDKMLAFLLQHYSPRQKYSENRPLLEDMTIRAAGKLHPALDTLEDSAVPADALTAVDYEAAPPKRAHDAPRVPTNLEETDDDDFDDYDSSYSEADDAKE